MAVRLCIVKCKGRIVRRLRAVQLSKGKRTNRGGRRKPYRTDAVGKQTAEMKSGEKANEFAKWLDDQSLNGKQKVAIKENLKFFAMMPMNAGKYDKLVEAGVDSNEAYTLTKELEELEPQGGKVTVSDLQKWRVSVDFSDDVSEQIAALSMVMSESQFRNVEVARDMGCARGTMSRCRKSRCVLMKMATDHTNKARFGQPLTV